MKISLGRWVLPCALCSAAAWVSSVHGEDVAQSENRSAPHVAGSVSESGSEVAPGEALAESIIRREEDGSGRQFDPGFRGRVKRGLGAQPLAVLETQAQGGRGLAPRTLGDSAADLLYTPLTPCRILDTRVAGGPVVPGATRNFLLTGSDLSPQGGSAMGCGVPSGATAAAVNLVAVNPAGAGDLRVAPYGSAMPLASSLNYAAVPGLNLANGLLVTLCDPGTTTCSSDLTVQADVSATHLVADVQGYFQTIDGDASTAVGSATIPPAGMTPLSVVTVFYAARSYGNALVRARGSCTMGPAGAASDDAIELAIGVTPTDAFNASVNPTSHWGILRIPVNSGAFQLMFSADRVWPTARGSIYSLSLFGRHADGSVADVCSGDIVVERQF